jgi:acetylornithine deacetylase/succinyl-diaminopimelate desuccinylase-like protein
MFEPVPILQQLIRLDTTNPPGNEAAAVHLVKDLVEASGIDAAVYAKDPSRPNLVARVPGTGDAPPLLLQGHVDVVPTTGQRWEHGPFSGDLVDGFVWGRGALDMKGPVVMMTHALARLAESGRRPAGDILLCVLSDEENRGDYGARFLVEEHSDLFAGVRYCIGEFGGFPFPIGGTTFYPIQVAERVGVEFRLVIRGEGGHGSLPRRGATPAKLGKMLVALDRKRMPVHLVPATRMMIEGMADHTTGMVRGALRSLLDPRRAGTVLRLLDSRLGALQPLFRNTVSVTVIHGGDKPNVIPAEIEVILDGRMLPGSTPAQMLAELRAIVGPEPEITYRVDAEPGPDEPDLGLFDLLAAAVRAAQPDAVPVPFLMPAVTDGRWFARLGIQPYGFTPLPLPAGFDFQSVVHAADERVPAAAIERGAGIVYDLLTRYPG